jgi:hypothetical protein
MVNAHRAQLKGEGYSRNSYFLDSYEQRRTFGRANHRHQRAGFKGAATGLHIQGAPSLFSQEPRRFLCNDGRFGDDRGAHLWKLRVTLTGKEDSLPPHFFRDAIRHSVFVTGFKLPDVPNPALMNDVIDTSRTRQNSPHTPLSW